jgi:hypothetical protein
MLISPVGRTLPTGPADGVSGTLEPPSTMGLKNGNTDGSKRDGCVRSRVKLVLGALLSAEFRPGTDTRTNARDKIRAADLMMDFLNTVPPSQFSRAAEQEKERDRQMDRRFPLPFVLTWGAYLI